MKKLRQRKVERYDMENGYIMEVEEDKNDPVCGLIWHFWITEERSGVKSYMFGTPADQTKAFVPHIVTKKEAIETAAAVFEDYIDLYEADVEAIECYEREEVKN